MTVLLLIVLAHVTFTCGVLLLVALRYTLEPPREVTPVPRIQMFLTHDERPCFPTTRGDVVARVRVWQTSYNNPVILVDLDEGDTLATTYSGKIATYAHHCLLGGRASDYHYIERRPGTPVCYCVHFHAVRHQFVFDSRHAAPVRDVEDLIGQLIED